MPEPRCIRCAQRVPWVTFSGNVALTLYKGIVGLVGGSTALLADAFHSFTDIIGTTVILISCRVSSRPPDEDHPYGHGKAEFMGAAFIYLVLTGLAGILFGGGLLVIIHWDLHPPSYITLLGALVSILANVLMYRLGSCAGRRNNSPALLANAFENRADAISSIAVVIGITLAIFVHPVCDPLAAMGVGVIIFVNCITELRKALAGLMDRSLPASALFRIRQVALAQKGVIGVRFLKTRPVGSKYWVDLGLSVKGDLRLVRAEGIAAAVREALMARSKHFHTVEVFLSREDDLATGEA